MTKILGQHVGLRLPFGLSRKHWSLRRATVGVAVEQPLPWEMCWSIFTCESLLALAADGNSLFFAKASYTVEVYKGLLFW